MRRRQARQFTASAMIALAALTGASACTITRGPHFPPAEGVRWAGFSTGSGLTLLGYDEEDGIDTAVWFALRGSPSDVDEALVAAHFTTKTVSGDRGLQSPSPLTGIDLSKVQGLRTAEDRWTNADGHILSRVLYRGRTTLGKDLIYVFAVTAG